MDRKIDTGTPSLLAEIHGHTGWLTFNNPARHNAMTTAMWRAIPVAMAAFDTDDAVRVIILRGAGDKAFVSGADISQFDTHVDDPAAAAAYDETLKAALDGLRASPRAVIAMIQGYCIGGGMSLALAADFRLAADDATFAIPAARLGLAYPRHLITDLTSVAGVPLAKELLFTARRLDANEAASRGLVNRTVPKDRLMAETRDLARAIADNAPLTVTAAKRAIDFLAKGVGAKADIDRLAEQCFNSKDYSEGRTAFAQKRTPKFEGR